MTGFLASLAARSIGRAHVLEPRRLLFEPRDDSAAEASPAPDAGPPTQPRAQPAGEGAVMPAPGDRGEHVEPRAVVARERTPPARRDATPAAGPAAAGPEPPASAAGEPPLPAAPARPARAVDARTERRPAPAPAAAPMQPRTPAPEPPVPVRAKLAGTLPLAPRPAPLRPPAVAARTAASDRDEQVVRITIGRVDVRAVQTPSEQPPRPRPAPPRMTLAEYLARGRRP